VYIEEEVKCVDAVTAVYGAIVNGV